MPIGVYVRTSKMKIGKFSHANYPSGSNHKNWKGGFENKRKEWQKKYIRKLRRLVLKKLGGKCIKCGFSNYKALQVDHIKGGGCKERREKTFKGEFNKYVLQSFIKKENKYQLLCANCNWIKKFNNKEL